MAVISRYGQSLLLKYRNFEAVQEQLENSILRVEAHWNNLELEIKFFANVQDFVEDQVGLHFEKLVNSLYAKLQLIGLQIEGISRLEKKTFFRKAKLPVLLKNSLEKTTVELSDYNTLLQPLLFLLSRNSDPRLDQKLDVDSNQSISAVHKLRLAMRPPTSRTHSAFMVFDENFQYGRRLIQHTTVSTKRLPEGRDVIIDPISCEGPTAVNTVKDVRDLARVLREVQPMTFGIPACRGLVKVKGADGKLAKIEMVFDVPKGLENPRSLRNLLISLNLGFGRHPINERVQLAKRLARTVFFVHSANFVHKNFRPETIILFDHRDKLQDQSLPCDIGFPFLVGFQKIRMAGGPTVRLGDTTWEQNLYRHPTRQGAFPEVTYKMEHDIYSLGVCLLEIALWKSFVLRDPFGAAMPSVESKRLIEGGGDAAGIKDKLVEMAREMIPTSLGNRYAEVTISCLQCMDPDGGDNAESLSDEETSVGAGYIEKVSSMSNTQCFGRG